MSGRGRKQQLQPPGRGKRHAQIVTKRLGISNPGFKRIAREVGIKRISKIVYPEMGEFLKLLLQRVTKHAIDLALYGRRKTITSREMQEALKRVRSNVYTYTKDRK